MTTTTPDLYTTIAAFYYDDALGFDIFQQARNFASYCPIVIRNYDGIIAGVRFGTLSPFEYLRPPKASEAPIHRESTVEILKKKYTVKTTATHSYAYRMLVPLTSVEETTKQGVALKSAIEVSRTAFSGILSAPVNIKAPELDGNSSPGNRTFLRHALDDFPEDTEVQPMDDQAKEKEQKASRSIRVSVKAKTLVSAIQPDTQLLKVLEDQISICDMAKTFVLNRTYTNRSDIIRLISTHTESMKDAIRNVASSGYITAAQLHRAQKSLDDNKSAMQLLDSYCPPKAEQSINVPLPLNATPTHDLPVSNATAYTIHPMVSVTRTQRATTADFSSTVYDDTQFPIWTGETAKGSKRTRKYDPGIQEGPPTRKRSRRKDPDNDVEDE